MSGFTEVIDKLMRMPFLIGLCGNATQKSYQQRSIMHIKLIHSHSLNVLAQFVIYKNGELKAFIILSINNVGELPVNIKLAT